jgi:hypothetical protein
LVLSPENSRSVVLSIETYTKAAEFQGPAATPTRPQLSLTPRMIIQLQWLKRERSLQVNSWNEACNDCAD